MTIKTCRATVPALCRNHGWLDRETYNMLSPQGHAHFEHNARNNYLANLFLDGFTAEDITMAILGPGADKTPADNLLIDMITTDQLKSLCVKEGVLK